jgi:hypothetical protein
MMPTASLAHHVYPDRLDFSLNSFVRMSWASARAEATWRPRVARIRAAIADIEWMAVTHKVRRCALLQLRAQEFDIRAARWAICGLAWETLHESSPRKGSWWLDAAIPRSTASYLVVVGSKADIATFARAWESRDDHTIGSMLGYPSCCRDFFEEVCIAQRCIDTIWPMSEREAPIDQRAFGRVVNGPVASNILLQALGVRAVPHAPCGFGCRETAVLAQELAGVAVAQGYGEEYRWLLNILSWPTEWSALHGIAEVRTPILKLCVPTDATAGEYVVRWAGASGIGFPYNGCVQTPSSPLVVLSNPL